MLLVDHVLSRRHQKEKSKRNHGKCLPIECPFPIYIKNENSSQTIPSDNPQRNTDQQSCQPYGFPRLIREEVNPDREVDTEEDLKHTN